MDHHHHQLVPILGTDPAPFEALIAWLCSPPMTSNRRRSPSSTSVATTTPMPSSPSSPPSSTPLPPHLEIHAMSVILLCKLLTRDSLPSPSVDDLSSPSHLWPRLFPTSQVSLKSLLLTSVQREDINSIAKKLYDTVSELAAGLLPDDAWLELLPFMFQSITSDNPRLTPSSPTSQPSTLAPPLINCGLDRLALLAWVGWANKLNNLGWAG